jgi:hypothetical protein
MDGNDSRRKIKFIGKHRWLRLTRKKKKKKKKISYEERDGAPKYHHVLMVCGSFLGGGRKSAVGGSFRKTPQRKVCNTSP